MLGGVRTIVQRMLRQQLVRMGNLKYIVLSILMALMVWEAILEAFNLSPKTASINYIDDPVLGLKPRVNASFMEYTSDNSGIQRNMVDIGVGDIGFNDDGINGSVYAIAIGDSFTLCNVNLTDCWTEVLERKLNKDVVNMGVAVVS